MPDYVDSISEVKRGESCKRVNLLEDILEHENLKDLFVCTTWNEKFPELFSALSKIQGDDWNHFANPINQELMNNRSIRNTLLGLTKDLDRKGGLDDLGKVIVSLSDSNFFGHLFSLLQCSLDDDSCVKITQEEIWEFFTFFAANQEQLEDVVKVVASFSTSLRGDGVSFKNALTNSLNSESFRQAREVFFNQIFTRMGSPEIKQELAFYQKMLVSDSGENAGWLPRVFLDDMTKEEANYLIRYPSDIHRSLWKDFRVLNKTLSVNVGCSSRPGYSDLNVDVSKHMQTFITLLFNGSQEDFFRNSLQSVAIMKGAIEICPNLKGYESRITNLGQESFINHRINFVDMLERTTSLMLNQKYYEFVSQMQGSSPIKEEDELHLIKYFSGDVFASFVEMLKVTDPSLTGLSASLYDVIISLPETGIVHIGKILRQLEERPDVQLASLAKVWSALGKEGRFFFFNFLDAHYTEGANITLLFDYYSALLKTSSAVLPIIFRQVLDEDRKIDVLNSMKRITKELGKDSLIEDYRSFFSRDHIVEIVKVISNGVAGDQFSDVLANYVIEAAPRVPVRVNNSYLSADTTKKCLNELIQPQNDFYSLLSSLPLECLPLKGSDPLFRFFDEVGLMGEEITARTGSYKVFTDKGMFSPEMLSTTMAIFKVMSDKYKGSTTEGLGAVLDNINTWINKNLRRNLVAQALNLPRIFASEKSDLVNELTRFYGSEENFKFLKHLVKVVPLTIKSRKAYERGVYNEVLTPKSFVQEPGYRCDTFHSQVGGRPCPTRAEIEIIVKRILKRIVKKHDDMPTALEQLMRMVAAQYGLPIPYESNNPRYKRVTLSESFDMFYNFTNSKYETNNKVFEYNWIPRADLNFFETENWEIKKKDLDKEIEPYNVKMNTMDRIEVVIRDVRFDQNYLGAHYMNSVAKGEDYNAVVDSKYGLLKTCIPLKFCGKFMNKAQHKFAKNSKETFEALLDVNTKEGWAYGDYMQSLLTSLVSSSPKKSQVSSVVNKRIFGLNIQIPWLQKKDDLVDHNGKVLGLVSMVGMFTNSARVLRDRTGRNELEFKNFLAGNRLKRTDEALFKNFVPDTHLPRTMELLKSIESTGFLSSFLDYVYKTDYSTQRLWESILFKGLYLASYLGDKDVLEERAFERYKDISVLDFLETINVLVNNHGLISDTWDFRKSDNLQNINHVIDVLISELESNNSRSSVMALNELAYFIKLNKEAVNIAIEGALNRENLLTIRESLKSLTDLLKELDQDEAVAITELFDAYGSEDSINWAPIRTYMSRSGAERVCTTQAEGFDCYKNPEHREIQQVLTYIFEDSSSRFFSLLDYIAGESNQKIKELFTRIFPSLNNQAL